MRDVAKVELVKLRCVVTVDEIPCAGIMGSKSGHIEAMIPLGKHEAGVVKAGVWDHDVGPLRVRS